MDSKKELHSSAPVFRMGIMGWLLLGFLVMGLLPLTIYGFMEKSYGLELLQGKTTENLKTHASRQVAGIKENLNRVVRDIIFLGELSALKRYLKNGSNDMFKDIEQEFMEFNRLHPEYYQVRYIDVTGQEIIRSNYKNGKFFLTLQDELQDKGDRYYFERGITLEKGDVYFSPIDYNIEYDKVEKPLLMVLRILTPVYHGDIKRGIVVINLYASKFFEWLKLPNTLFTSLLVDSTGKIIHIERNNNPNVLDQPLEVGGIVFDYFPEIEKRQLIVSDSTTMELQWGALSVHPVRGSGDFNAQELTLITLLPAAYISQYANVKKLPLLISLIVVTVAAFIFSVLMARKFKRPLRELYKGVGIVNSGNLEHKIRTNSSVEFEDLAEKFDKMRVNIKDRQAQITDLTSKLNWHKVEIRNLNRQLFRADKLASLGELSMRIAHEIGNPLASIKTVTQAISEETPKDEKQLEFFNKIVSEVDRLNIFLKKFNDYAVMKEAEPVSCDLRELVKDVNFFLKAQANECGVSVVEVFDDKLEKVLVDAQQIKQVVINLALNAIQETPNDGIVQVSLRSVGECPESCAVHGTCFCKSKTIDGDTNGFLELCVCDSGKGIPESDLIKIFDPFYTTKSNGTGLGLAIAHNIIENHNGMIRVYSKVGVGTSIKVYLPKIASEALHET